MNKFENARKETEKFFEAVESRHGYAERAAEFEHAYAIAAALHEAREHAKLSQKDLAFLLRTTQSVISRMESGKANTTLARLQEYAAACGGRLEVRIAF